MDLKSLVDFNSVIVDDGIVVKYSCIYCKLCYGKKFIVL